MPTRPVVDNAQIPLMRKSEFLCDGYPLPLVQSFGDDLVISDETIDVYGYEQQLYYRVLQGATVRLDCIEDKSMQVIFDVATGQNPNAIAKSTTVTPALTANQGTLERQTLSATGATAGTVTLTFGGQTSVPVSFNASAAQVQAALEGITSLGPGAVACAGGPLNTTPITIDFKWPFSGDVALITLTPATWSGTAAAVAETTKGVAPTATRVDTIALADAAGLPVRGYVTIVDATNGDELCAYARTATANQVKLVRSIGAPAHGAGATVEYATQARGYYPNENIRVDLLRNFADSDGTGYESVDYFPAFAAVIRNPAGGPNDRGTVRLEGRSKTPLRITAPSGTKIAGLTDVAQIIPADMALLAPSGYEAYAAGYAPLSMAKIPKTSSRPNATFALGLEAHAAPSRLDHATVNKIARLEVTHYNTGAPEGYNTASIASAGSAVAYDLVLDDAGDWPASGTLSIWDSEELFNSGAAATETATFIRKVTGGLPTNTLTIQRPGSSGSPAHDGTVTANYVQQVAGTAKPIVTTAMTISNVDLIELGAAGNTGYAPCGFVQVQNEIIGYSGKSADGTKLTGLIRGMRGTAPATHAAGQSVTPLVANVILRKRELEGAGLAVGLLNGSDQNATQSSVATHAFVTYIHTPPAGTNAGQQGGRCLLGDGIPYQGRFE